jgi:hypothetical protein
MANVVVFDDNDLDCILTTRTVKQWLCDICRKRYFPTMEEAVAHEQVCKPVMAIAEAVGPSVHAFFRPKPPPRPQSRRKRKTIGDASTSATGTASVSTKRLRSKLMESDPKVVVLDLISPKKESLEKQTKSGSMESKPKRKEQQSQLPWTEGADERRKVLAQNRAAEFQIQRRLKGEQERERQRKRMEANARVSTVPLVIAASKPPKRTAERFPNPNHVFEACEYSAPPMILSRPWLKEADMEHIRRSWRLPSTPLLLEANSDVPLKSADWAESSPNLLDIVFGEYLIPPTSLSDSSQLLQPMKTIPEDCVGTSLKAAANSVVEWVQEWKRVRQRCLELMAAKQQRRRKKSRTTKRKYNDDNDWMSDDDNDQGDRLPALCLLTGPVGCGKSDLVQAVAAHLDCLLIEMSTADRRGAAAVRHAIGEATQSLSSYSGTRKQSSLFLGAQHKEELVDSDTDADAKAGSSLTIILIDEVDNLYEENGDNGFWIALAELSKHAKCPIFLTANVFPEPLISAAFCFKHVAISAPTPAECVPVLQQWIQTGCFGTTANSDEFSLERVASLCHCDLRKMAHELELFSYSHVSRSSCNHPDWLSDKPSHGRLRPVVLDVAPRGVRSTEHALLTITGTNFLTLAEPPDIAGYLVDVFVGEELCPQGRIMDDSTILAVCPPIRGASASSMFHAYAPIRVCGVRKIGLLSDSDGFINELCDNMSLASVAKPVYLERHFSGSMESCLLRVLPPCDTTKKPRKDSLSDSSDEKFEFIDDQASARHPTECLESTLLLSMEDDKKKVAVLLKEGIDAWYSVHDVVPEVRNLVPEDNGAVKEMEIACFQSGYLSDAALLEDVGMTGIPFLAGSARGFGYDLTDTFPRCTNGKNKR